MFVQFWIQRFGAEHSLVKKFVEVSVGNPILYLWFANYDDKNHLRLMGESKRDKK